MKYRAAPAGKKLAAARLAGLQEEHPADCACRKCRRMRVARKRRKKTRWGQ